MRTTIRACHVAFLSTTSFFAVLPCAQAVDFKIDLPLEEGRDGRAEPGSLLDIPEESVLLERAADRPSRPGSQARGNAKERAADVIVAQPENGRRARARKTLTNIRGSRSEANTDVDVNSIADAEANTNAVPLPAVVAERPKTLNNINFYETRAFPMLQCLEDNVAFWTKVYAEADINDAIVHDRENLGRIFAIVKVPAGGKERGQAMRAYRDHFAGLLEGLAESIDDPRRWTSQQRSVAKLFRADELNEAALRRSINNIRLQTGLKSRFEAGVQRSLRYLPTVHTIVQSQGLPVDIVHLPHVESSYTPHARSKVGAVGLWQIMPRTMRDLMGSRLVNARTDVSVATVAAAKLLRQNFEATRSWPLALTAYNHGLSGVLRAQRQTGSADLCEIIERYNSASFRFASSNFYAQFLAARNLALQRYEVLSKRQGHGKILRPVLASHTKGRS